MNSSFASKSKQLASYDVGASKSLDRNLGKANIDPKHTIMTAHEPYARTRLEMMGASNKDMVRINPNYCF